MADTPDPNDLVTIEALAASGLWEQAGLVEALRLKELLTKQEILDALTELHREDPQAALPHVLLADPSRMTEIERNLFGDILTLFDDGGLTRERTLTLLGQVSVLIELVKRGQVQRTSQ